jgi:hypothetical protein
VSQFPDFPYGDIAVIPSLFQRLRCVQKKVKLPQST